MNLDLTCPHCGHVHDNTVAPNRPIGWIGSCVNCGELAIITDDCRFRRLQVFDLASMPPDRAAGLLRWHKEQLADIHLARYMTRRMRMS